MVIPTPTTVQVKIQLRGDTAANWASVNPVLLTNELGLETDTKKIKVGNGSTAWNSLAYFPFVVSGGTVTGNLEIGTTGTLTFEGSSADNFETTLGVVNPTADRTINLPNVSGTIITTGDTGTVTSAMIADGTIVNADVSASAAIAHSKLATITAGYVLIGNASNVPTATAVTGDVTINSTGITSISSGVIVNGDVSASAEIAVSKLANGTVNQVLVTDGTDVSWSDDLTLAGNLTVNGTTTTVNTETLTVKDKNIELAVVDTPTDTTANGGGITLKGATDKTLNWVETGASWTSSENVDLATGKSYKIGSTNVLSANTLGSGVINSSLTSVGTIGTGIWQGTAISSGYGGTGQASYADGELLIGKTDGTLAKATLTAGSNVTIVNADGSITVSATDTNTTYTAGTGLSLTDTTFSIDSSVVTTSDTGSVTSTMIADGTIVNGDVSASAAIAGSKISPNFGSQTVTTTGVFSAATGTAASPSITFTGDTNTGIYSPGGDQLAISTNESQRLLIDASGNVNIDSNTLYVDATNNRVGLGTSSPTERLEVANGSIAGSVITGRTYTLTNVSSSNPTTVNGSGFTSIPVQVGDIITFPFSQTRTVTSVVSDTQLTVNSAWTVSFAGSNVTGTGGLGFRTNSTNRVAITAGGNVGIGTTGPATTLHAQGTIRTSRTNGDPQYIDIYHNGGEGYIDSVNANSSITGSISFRTGNNSLTSEKMKLDSSGRLLVGTSNATNNIRNGQKLAVTTTETSNNGGISLTNYGGTNVNYAPILDFQRSRGTTDGSFTEVVSGDRLGYIVFRGADGAGWSDAALILSEADGDWTTSGDTTDSPGRLVFSTTADGASSPTERMTIDSSGDVKIGGTLPSSPNASISSAGDAYVKTVNVQNTAYIVTAPETIIDASGTLDLSIPGPTFVGTLYVTSVRFGNAAIRTVATYFVAGRVDNNVVITALNSANGSTGGNSFTVTDASVAGSSNIIRLTNTSGASARLAMTFMGGRAT